MSNTGKRPDLSSLADQAKRRRAADAVKSRQAYGGGYGYGLSGAQTGLADLLTPEEAARRLGVRTNLLAKWRSAGGGPRYAKFGRHIRYPVESLREWVEGKMMANTSQALSGEAETNDARGEGPRASE